MTTYPLNTLTRLARRTMLRRPLQSLFLIIGVAIGVAMIVAIDLANGSAQRAFELGTETVAGRATHQVLGGPTGLDQQVYVDLRRQTGFQQSAPVVEGYVIAEELDAQPMTLLGVDPFSESPFRSYLQGDDGRGLAPDFLGQMMSRPNTVLMSKTVADRYGVQTGDPLAVKIGSEFKTLEIIGLLAPSDDLSRRALDGLLISDIAAAQELLGMVGKLNRIDLIVPVGQEEAVLDEISDVLPPSARIERASARAGTVDEMTAAFRLNLTALSLLALVVGMFLIYNTVTFSVVQRRPMLGGLRSLGMTQGEIFALILAEAALLGIIGTVAGLGLGILLGQGAVQLVTQTMNDLFFVVAVRDMSIPAWTLIKGAVFGMAAALIGATVPAYEATSVPPAGALKRSDVEDRTRAALPWLSLGGIALLAVGAGLLIPEWHLAVAFGGLFAIVLGCALLTPALVLLLMGIARGLLGQRADLIGRMAPRYIIRSLSRTSVAVAALMVAVSVIIGVGVMIGSFRQTVELWLNDTLQADVFVTPAGGRAAPGGVRLAEDVVERLRTYPGVTEMGTSHFVGVAAYLSEEALAARAATPVRLAAITLDLAGEDRRYQSAIGSNSETWQAMEDGGAIINEPMANRTGLTTGDTIILQTDQGPRPFPIVGVSVDFDVNFTVLLHDPVYRTYWEDEAVSAAALFVEPTVDVDEKVAELRAAFAGKAELGITSNRGLRENALEVFDRTFAITVALQLLATLVAFIGILSTLMSLQLERIREIGVLRANGMTRGQLWRMSMLETGLIGSSAGLIAVPTGFLLALILIYIINLRSFGWTLEMQLQPRAFLQAFAVALIAALLAGVYPAWKMGLTQPAEAVRAE